MSDKIDYDDYMGFADPKADKSVLKDGRGVLRTRSLFKETFDYRVKDPNLVPLYTLAEDTKHGLPSIWRIFMDCDTETEAALKIVGSLRHWDVLCNCRWFQKPELRDTNGIYVLGLDKWREYKAKKEQDMIKSVLMQLALSGNVNAAKALLAGQKVEEPKVTAKKKKEEEVAPMLNSEEADIMADSKLLQLVR